jgi:hypothetical protein
VQNHLSKQLMDVVTAYLYGSLDFDIYMKVPDRIDIPNIKANRKHVLHQVAEVTIWLKTIERNVV